MYVFCFLFDGADPLLVETPVLEALRDRKRDRLGHLISVFWSDRSLENLAEVLDETQTYSTSEYAWYRERHREYMDRRNSG
jgi:hypothetical protein